MSKLDTTNVPFSEAPYLFGLPSPYYKEKHHKLRIAVRNWVEEYIVPNLHEWEDAGETPQWAYQQAAKDGLLVPIACGTKIDPIYYDPADGRGIIGGFKPEEWDGFMDFVMAEELSRAGGSGPTTGLFAGLQIGFPMLKDHASPALRNKYLGPILRGEKRICLAITEPEAGSENKNISTTAVKKGDHYVVNGLKKFITNGIHADVFATAVRTAGKPGDRHGISVLIVPRGPGVTTRKLKVQGTNSAGTSYVEFNDVIAPVENLVGPEHNGLKIVFSNFNHERLGSCYAAIALTRTVINDAIAYTSNRIVDGQPLVKKGVVLHRLAKMAIMVESQQAWIESVIYQLEHLSKEEGSRLLGGTTALLKANCSLVLEPCASQALQLCGGNGYSKGGIGDRVERIFREIKAYSIPAGAEDVMLDLGMREHLKLGKSRGAKI